ncbi:MAG: glycosyltransferase family 4 protein [Armatimonadota bacterium]|nr:glycosyltransferase family 4 protein [Armatimonadota bacterium]
MAPSVHLSLIWHSLCFLNDNIMKTLLLIPGETKDDPAQPRPRQNAEALTAALNIAPGSRVETLNFADAARDTSPAVRLARACGGPEAALSMLGFQRRHQYDAVCSLGEGVGLPLALLLNTAHTRPGHVCCAHSLSSPRQRLFWNLLQAHRGLDTVFVSIPSQQDFAEDHLGFSAEKLSLISPALDEHFFRPGVGQSAAEGLSDVVGGQATVWPDSPAERRALYAGSLFVALPPCDTDGPTRAEVILEAMAMGKAVIATRTHGQAEVIIEGVTGLSVAPGDVGGWRQATARLRDDAALRERLGRNARRWVEEHATLEQWAERVRHALHEAARNESGARLPRRFFGESVI